MSLIDRLLRIEFHCEFLIHQVRFISFAWQQDELQLAMRQLEQNNAKLKDVVAEEEMAQKQVP